MTNYPEKCHINGCPCHDWSAKSPSETYYGHPRLDTWADLAVGGAGTSQSDPQHPFQPSEGLNRQQTQNRAIPVSGNEQESEQPTKYPPVIEQAFRCWNEHRAYVDDNDNYRVKQRGSVHGPIASWNRAVKELFPSYREFHAAASEFENVPDSPALRRTRSILHHAELVEERKHAQLTFEQEWQSAPKSIKHGCEEVSAEFFYHAGRRDRETEMLREVNEILSGVVGRIERERVR